MSDDAASMILGANKVPVYMISGYAWDTASGVSFSKEHPFQLMEYGDAMRLIDSDGYRFRLATPEEIKAFYTKENGKVRLRSM